MRYASTGALLTTPTDYAKFVIEVIAPKPSDAFHGGDNDGFHCCAVASVEGKSGFVVMTNGENGPAILKNLITGNLMQEFLGG
jgi:hypothetical protein